MEKYPEAFSETPGGSVPPLSCVQQPGDILWLPPFAWHASATSDESMIIGAHHHLTVDSMLGPDWYFQENLQYQEIALEDNKMVRALLEDAGLSRMWSKWGDVFARPGSAYSGQFVRGDVPVLRPDGLPTQLYGGWSMTYDQMLDLREEQLGGMGLLLEPIPSLGIPKMPRVEWGMSSADRARLLGKIKPAKRAWIKNKHQRKAKEAAKKKAERKRG